MPGAAAAGMDPAKMQEQMMIKYVSPVAKQRRRHLRTNLTRQFLSNIQMSHAMELCPAKMAISGVMGFGLGGLFGLFMASMRYDTPMGAGAPGSAPTIPMREQIKAGFKDMGKSAWSSAKNFGYIGGIYAGSECAIEGFRAKSDLANGVAAGCFTGGFLARSAGPQAAAVGCAGFAAFSAAIDAYMRMPSDDKAADPII
jgi:import inner membrane translocase subunit TIM22